ncbi:MAG: YceI family protein [Alphaproteobacteria bacterium]|nr:YceI family protein [Alphaproteobacteria bacterium]
MLNVLSLLAALIASPGADLVPDAYAQDGAKTYNLKGLLYLQVYKDPDTIAAALAHDHVVRASGWSGTVTWDAADLSKCDVRITVPVNSLAVDEEDLRRQLGYDTFPKAGEREDIKKEMLSEDQLFASKHPQITYKSSKCEAQGDNVAVTGDLTIRGVTRPVTLTMTVKADQVNFQAKGSTAIKATDFGFDAYSAGFGALKNQNRMVMVINVKGDPS